MVPETFRDWLADRVGNDPKVARRELARRLVVGSGLPASSKLVESQRRNIRRILNGDVNPRQTTRDSIQAALNDFTAPSVEDEAEANDTSVSIEELRRETESLTRRLNQVVKAMASAQRRSEAAA